jgi:hypothetical protein
LTISGKILVEEMCIGHYKFISLENAEVQYGEATWYLQAKKNTCPYLGKLLGYFVWSLKQWNMENILSTSNAVSETAR